MAARRSAAAATTLLVVVLALGAWSLVGGGWRVVETPSMGTTAPVGSLVQLGAADVTDLEVGDLVVVRPAGTSQTWTHEVTRVHADGTVTTAGRLSGPDPWRTGDDELVGRVVRVVPGLGSLVEAAPLLIVSAVATALLLRRTPPSRRLPLGVLVAAAAVSLALVVHHPLDGAQQLRFEPAGDGAVGEWVNTGLLPMRVVPVVGSGEPSAVVGPGEVARVAFDSPGEGGRYAVRGTAQVPWSVWSAVLLACFLPAVVETVRRRPTLRA